MADVPDADVLTPGTKVGDHFVVIERLGGGGMGDVYLVENLNLPDKRYAIKVLRPEYSGNPRFADMLYSEARKQSRLEHDNVVQIYDLLVWRGHYCVVQSYIKGPTLAALIAQQPGGLALAQALPLVLDVLTGLDFAHQSGILHCDVKPGNVIVDGDGRARVTDFGISRDIGASPGDGSLLGAGTVGYMSPEQIEPPYLVDHRSDVYAAGILLFEMLTGRLPFGEPGATAMAAAQMRGDVPDIRTLRPDVPEVLARIVATALQRNPAARFQGCGDFRQAVVDFQRRERWRRTWLPAIVVASVVGVVAAVGLYQWRVAERAHIDAESAAVQRKSVEVRQQAQAAQEQHEQAVRETVRNAASAINLLCREAADLKLKRDGLSLSRKLSETPADLERTRKFERRVADMDANLDAHAGAYVHALRQLNALASAQVADALSAPANADTQAQALRARIVGDEAAARDGRLAADPSLLAARCAR